MIEKYLSKKQPKPFKVHTIILLALTFTLFLWFCLVIIVDVKTGLDSEAVRKKLASDKTRVKRTAKEEAALAMSSQLNEENERFIGDTRQQQKKMIKQQDQNLGHLDQALDRLKGRADLINEEVKDQEGLINQLGNDIDKNQAELGSVQDSLGRLLNTKDGCQIWTIVILAGVLILLGELLFALYRYF